VTVVNGQCVFEFDAGRAFEGERRWLEHSVRRRYANGTFGSWTKLTESFLWNFCRDRQSDASRMKFGAKRTVNTSSKSSSI